MPFNISSDDSDKVLKVPKMRKCRTIKNFNKEDCGEELELSKEVKMKKVVAKKQKLKKMKL